MSLKIISWSLGLHLRGTNELIIRNTPSHGLYRINIITAESDKQASTWITIITMTDVD